MSLKTVHLVFVASAILLSFGLAAWSFMQVRGGEGAGYAWFGAGWMVAGSLMSVYGRRVLRKLRSLSYA